MRFMIPILALSFVLLSGENDQEAIEVLKKAIAAHGGKDRLVCLNHYREVIFSYRENDKERTNWQKTAYIFRSPASLYGICFAMPMEDGMSRDFHCITNDKTAWVKFDDKVVEMSKEHYLSPKEKW